MLFIKSCNPSVLWSFFGSFPGSIWTCHYYYYIIIIIINVVNQCRSHVFFSTVLTEVRCFLLVIRFYFPTSWCMRSTSTSSPRFTDWLSRSTSCNESNLQVRTQLAVTHFFLWIFRSYQYLLIRSYSKAFVFHTFWGTWDLLVDGCEYMSYFRLCHVLGISIM